MRKDVSRHRHALAPGRKGRGRTLLDVYRYMLALMIVTGGCFPGCQDEPSAEPRLLEARPRLAAQLRDATCLPQSGEYVTELETVDGETLVCMSQGNHQMIPIDVPLACWRWDVTTRTLAPRPAAIPPGHSAFMRLDHGRVDGYRIGPASWNEDLDESTYVVARSTDPERVAVANPFSADIYVFDVPTSRLVTRFKGEPCTTVTSFRYIGDRIVRAGYSDPFAEQREITTWRDDGVLISKATAPPTDDYLDVPWCQSGRP